MIQLLEEARTTKDQERLAVLAGNSEWYIREAVARNPHTPGKILAELAKDEEKTIRVAVARNLNTWWDTLEMLSYATCRNGRDIRWAVAGNPNTCERTLERLMHDPGWEVREAAKKSLKELRKKEKGVKHDR